MTILKAPPNVNGFIQAMRAALAEAADPTAAVAMRAYMRNQFDYLGIPSGPRRAATIPIIKGLGVISAEDAVNYARALWAQPQREYRYVAVDLLLRCRKGLNTESIPALLELARDGAWWDTVDGMASVIGNVIQAERRTNPDAQRQMDAALVHENLWTRRIAMIHQVGWKTETDADRLFDYARTLAGESDFFIRKAIGWALRDYARHDPDGVRAFLDEMGSQLSPLSVREAAKHLSRA